VSTSQVEPEKNGNITFQPNVIPDTEVFARVGKNKLDNTLNDTYGSGERFRFRWQGNSFDIELFFNATYKDEIRLFSLRDFEADFEVTVSYITNRNDSVVQFGWVIDNVEDLGDLVHDAWFKIEDAQPFDYDEIILDTFEVQEEPYNITRFHLPDNLVLSFEDLQHKGFIIGHQNKTATSIKGFSGNSSWNLDPITYASPTITVIGGTSGAPLTFLDIWNADQAGGWNVVINNNNTNTQYEYNAKIVFGNGTGAGITWFNDTNKQITFNDGVMTARYERWMFLNAYTYVTFGVLESSSLKTSSQGVDFISLWDDDWCYIIFGGATSARTYVYSSSFQSAVLAFVRFNAGEAYNILMTENAFIEARSNVDYFNINVQKASYGIYYPTGTWDRVLITDCTYTLFLRYSATVYNIYSRGCTDFARPHSFKFGDFWLVNPDSDIWTFDFTADSVNEVYRQYEFDLTVTTSANVPIENANVTLTYYGQGGGTHGTWLTNALGQIPSQTVTAGFYNQTGGDTIYDYNPYEITITQAGYLTYQRNFTQLEAKSWNIALLPTTPVTTTFNSVYYLVGLATFLPFLLLLMRKRLRNGD